MRIHTRRSAPRRPRVTRRFRPSMSNATFPSPGSPQRPPTEQEVGCIKKLFQKERRSLIDRATGMAWYEAILEPPETIAIQKALQAKGYLPSTATIDGVLGPMTRTAIVSWQRDNGVRDLGYGSKSLLEQLVRGSVSGSGAAAPRATPPASTDIATQQHPSLPINIDRSGKTNAMKLALGEGVNLQPQDVFEKAGAAVFVVQAQDRLGSAVAVSERELLTNCHIVGSRPTVLLEREGQEMRANLISANPDADRCVLASETPLQRWVKNTT